MKPSEKLRRACCAHRLNLPCQRSAGVGHRCRPMPPGSSGASDVQVRAVRDPDLSDSQPIVRVRFPSPAPDDISPVQVVASHDRLCLVLVHSVRRLRVARPLGCLSGPCQTVSAPAAPSPQMNCDLLLRELCAPGERNVWCVAHPRCCYGPFITNAIVDSLRCYYHGVVSTGRPLITGKVPL